jgi:very-short-patch-repair endonuclease
LTSSDLETLLEKQLLDIGVEDFVREHRFHPVRRWRFDFAWPDRLFAVEVDGGTMNFGRHNRPGGFAKDAEKMNTATLMGWRILRFDAAMVKDETAITVIEEGLMEFLPLFPQEMAA